MRELPEAAEARAAWLSQPEERTAVDIESPHRQRTSELFSTTRSEVIGSIGAALFFAAVVAWRFAPERDGLVLSGCAGVILWAVVTAFRFRYAIRRHTPPPGAIAITGLEYYRQELLRRRDHLRSIWIWHGPLLLACMLSAATLGERIAPGRLWNALPVILVLAAALVIGIRRRFRAAAELQREIDEMKQVGKE